MEERTQNTETKIRRDIPLGDLSNFCSGVAEVADDIIGESGGILLPRGTPLSSLASSIDRVEAKLRRSSIRAVPIVLPGNSDLKDLEDYLKVADPAVMPLEPELARQTVSQVEDVFGRIKQGQCTTEDVRNLADQGRILARRISGAPQLMFCLGQVRNWDEYTSVHSLNVALLSSFLAERLYPGRTELAEFMAIGGILHDLGKARVPLEVLNKPGKLEEGEFAIMKKHPELGEELAASNGITDRRSLDVIRKHHERYNGGGYPDNLNGTAISIEARIAAVADVFDALTAKRVYKNPMPSREAMSVMTGAMSTHFDPDVMRVLLLSVGIYPSGSLVELSDGSVGTVVGAYGKDLVRPKVAISLDRFGNKLTEKKIIDLSEERELFVKRALPSNEKDKLAF